MDPSDKDQIKKGCPIDYESVILLKSLVYPTLNLPSAGRVDVICSYEDQSILVDYLREHSIASVDYEDSPVITIYDLQNLGMPKYLETKVRKDNWERYKVELEKFIADHGWPTRPEGNIVSVRLGLDDLTEKSVKTNIARLSLADLFSSYRPQHQSSDYQLIAILPPRPNKKQFYYFVQFLNYLKTQTRYYYHVDDV